MREEDKSKSPMKTVVRSILIIVWWVAVWGLTDFVVHHMSNKCPLRKIAVYLGLMLLVLGTLGLDPNILHHM